jgi:hypothetical protein
MAAAKSLQGKKRALLDLTFGTELKVTVNYTVKRNRLNITVAYEVVDLRKVKEYL